MLLNPPNRQPGAINRGGLRNARRGVPADPFADLYGTGLGQMPMDIDPAAAVLDGSGNVTSIANKGGAGAAFDATATATGITRTGGLLNVPDTSVYLSLANAADLAGARLFMVASVSPALTDRVNFAGHAVGVSDGQRTNIYWEASQQRLLLQRRDEFGLKDTAIPSSAALPAGLNLIEVEIAAGQARFWINGTLRGTAAFSWANFYLTRIFAGFSIPFFAGQGGRIQSVITDGTPALDPVMLRVRQTLAGQFGITVA